jgi:hypothetical protein
MSPDTDPTAATAPETGTGTVAEQHEPANTAVAGQGEQVQAPGPETTTAAPVGAQSPVVGSDEPVPAAGENITLSDVLQEQARLRQELLETRRELDQRTAAPAPSALPVSEEEALQARYQEIAEHDFYCPGCGRLYDYQRQCQGSPTAPHPPIEVVSTDEIHEGANPDDHTPAPASE